MGSMEEAELVPFPRTTATTKLCSVSRYKTELLEIKSKNPLLQVLFIPGNPGIVSFYKDFIEALYEYLEGLASITAIGHISHGGKDHEHGRVFTLQEQIDHKVDYMEQELKDCKVPVVLVGHSIGAHICLELFKIYQQKVGFFIGMYPFLTLDKNSSSQSTIGVIVRSSLLCEGISFLAYSIGLLPISVRRGVVKRLIGPTWSATALDAACYHLLKYHSVRNMLFMARTEFSELSKEPDWSFIGEEAGRIAFLFGDDDHWGPLGHLEEIARRVPSIALSVEREGLTHSFSCTRRGSSWVAGYVAELLRNKVLKKQDSSSCQAAN